MDWAWVMDWDVAGGEASGSHDDFRGDTVVVHNTARTIEITHCA
jgi:hypothetical protein